MTYEPEGQHPGLETPIGLHFPRALSFPAFEGKRRPALFIFQGVMDSQRLPLSSTACSANRVCLDTRSPSLFAVYMCKDSIALESISHECPTKDQTWNSSPLTCQWQDAPSLQRAIWTSSLYTLPHRHFPCVPTSFNLSIQRVFPGVGAWRTWKMT